MCVGWTVLAASTAVVAGQTVPAGPASLAGGRVVVAGDVATSMAPADEGFFNYSDYEHSTLREIRTGISVSVRASDYLTVLGEVRSQNQRVVPFALFARVRPWRSKRLDINLGRVPPTFGTFTRRLYGRDNPLIGQPLAYQYLTSLRSNALPASADELAHMRGRGWLSTFGVGNPTPERGLPLVTAFSWDAGVQVTAAWDAAEVTASVTNGTPSNPRVRDDNRGKQIATRVSTKAVTGAVLGISFAQGEFLARPLASLALPNGDRSRQTVWGLDAEYSLGRWLARADLVISDWRLPILGEPGLVNPLRATATAIEARYTVAPGFYVAGRAEHLGFSDVPATARVVSWDAAVTRVEVGAGYYLQRNLIARASVQVNRRDGGRVQRLTLPAVQLLYWF